MKFLLIVIVLSMLIPSAYAIQQPIVADATCLLIDVAPYYDCNEILLIVVFDQKYPPRYNWVQDSWYEQDPDTESLGSAYRYMPIPDNLSWNDTKSVVLQHIVPP